MNSAFKLVLGVHPSSRGFGWVLFDGPISPFDWGTADVRGGNTEALLRLDEICEKYTPHALTLEEFEQSRRVLRTRQLCGAIIALAEARRISVHRYSREEIQTAHFPARTRQEVAEHVAARIGLLARRLPKPRKLWDGEHPNMALFCAAACVLAFYASAPGPAPTS